MKEKKTKTAPTKDESNDEMTNDLMNDLLVELYGTKQYKAINALLAQKDALIISSLCSIDAFKNPTDVARNQGMRMGLYFLGQYIEMEKKRRSDSKSNEE